MAQEEKKFVKKCQGKKENPLEVWMIWNESFIDNNTIRIVTMLQKVWALFAYKGTKSEWKSCCDPSNSLGTSNGGQLKKIWHFFGKDNYTTLLFCNFSNFQPK